MLSLCMKVHTYYVSLVNTIYPYNRPAIGALNTVNIIM